MHCSAYGCNNCSSAAVRRFGITFHKFPNRLKDKKRFRQWMINLRWKNWEPTENSRLCSEHFQPECFDRTGQTVRLRPTAVPTRFSFPTHLSKKLKPCRKPRGTARDEASLQEVTLNPFTTSCQLPVPPPFLGTGSLLDHTYAAQTPTNLAEAALNSPTTQAQNSMEHSEQRDIDTARGTTENVCRDPNTKVKKAQPQQPGTSQHHSETRYICRDPSRNCSAKNCKNTRWTRPDLSFFRYPKKVDLCRKWAINSGRKYALANWYLCSEHFEESQFIRGQKKNLLVSKAVPTLFDVSDKPHRTSHTPGKEAKVMHASDVPQTPQGKSESDYPSSPTEECKEESPFAETAEGQSLENLPSDASGKEPNVGTASTKSSQCDPPGTPFALVHEEPPIAEDTPPSPAAQKAPMPQIPPDTDPPVTLNTRSASPIPDETFVAKEEPLEAEHPTVPDTRPVSPPSQKLSVTGGHTDGGQEVQVRCSPQETQEQTTHVLPTEALSSHHHTRTPQPTATMESPEQKSSEMDESVCAINTDVPLYDSYGTPFILVNEEPPDEEPPVAPVSPPPEELLVTAGLVDVAEVGLQCYTTTPTLTLKNPKFVSAVTPTAAPGCGGGAFLVPLPLPSQASGEQCRPDNTEHYLLVKQSKLEKLLGQVCCKVCGGKVKLCVQDEGFDAALSISCCCARSPSACEFWPDAAPKYPRVSGHFTEVNLSVVYHVLVSGEGYDRVQAMAKSVKRPAMTVKTFQAYTGYLYERMEQHYLASMEEARRSVQNHYLLLGHVPNVLGYVAISVVFGWTGLIVGQDTQLGIGLVVEADSGVMLDFVVLTTCSLCSTNRRKLLPSAFELWHTTHRCHSNFDGQEHAMEGEAAVRLWRQSTWHGFLYTTFVGDGESVAYQAVRSMQGGAGPYSVPVLVEKSLSRVSRQLRARLEDLMKDTAKVGGMGKDSKQRDGTVLTKCSVTRLTTSFASAVEKNSSAGVVVAQRTVWRVLQHRLHSIRQTACKEQQPHQRKLSQAAMQQVKGVLREFTSVEVIKKCLSGGVQHLLPKFWVRMSREECANLHRMFFMTRVAILENNFGQGAAAFLASFGLSAQGAKRKRKD